MSEQLEIYKSFIDGLVARRESIDAKRLREGTSCVHEATDSASREFIGSMSSPQRALLANLLQAERDAGMHDVLASLNELMNLHGVRLTCKGTELPHEPFGTELHYDFVSRSAGDSWPS